jgi:quercetin dioxygenase-like cupin family protein
MARRPDDIPTRVFDWGTIKWLVAPELGDEAGITVGEVIIYPGQGHAPHTHEAEEVLYIVSGEGSQTVGEGTEPFPVVAGDAVYVPYGAVHSTYNTTWSPMRLIAVYNPKGPEQVLDGLPDATILAPGVAPAWRKA